MIKLAVFDVDGTLVTKGNRRVPASCVHALNELSRKGVKLAPVADLLLLWSRVCWSR